MNTPAVFVVKGATFKKIGCLTVIFALYSGCTKFQTNNSPGNKIDVGPTETTTSDIPGTTGTTGTTGTPETPSGQAPLETPFYSAKKALDGGAIAPDSPGKINLYIDHHSFNPTVPKNTFVGIKNMATLDCGKVDVGEKTEPFVLKILNDKSEAVNLAKPVLAENMTIEFDASHEFPMRITSKASVSLAVRLSATTQKKSKLSSARPMNRKSFYLLT